MNIPWEPVDEQRLLAYKKEDKSWGWIFGKFPRQDSGRSTHALDNGTAQSQISFLPQVDRQQLKLCVPICPSHLLGGISNEDLVLQSAEGSGTKLVAFKTGRI
jgi:hypothetical protein